MTHEEFLQMFPDLIMNYQPTPEVLSHIGNIELLMIIGPSGVGKTSIINKVGVPFVITDVTRNPRANEKNAVDYYFRNDYDRIINEIKDRQFVQTAVGPGGDFYATRSSSYPVFGQGVMAIVADVIPIFRRLGFGKTISAYIVPPSKEEWTRRLNSLGIASDVLVKRLAEAKRSLEFALNDDDIHFILNDELDAAVQQTKDLLAGKVDSEREALAKKTAKELLDSIN